MADGQGYRSVATGFRIVALAVIFCVACERAEQDRSGTPYLPGSADFVVVDSAGIAVSMTSGNAAHSPLDWSIDPVRRLELGAGVADHTQFHRIRGIAGLPDAGVVVLDGGSRELRFYGADGNLLARTGGEGAGPGEFREPALLPSPLIDSLVIFDGPLGRYTVHSRSGTDPRLLTAPETQGRRPPLGIVDGRVLVQRRPAVTQQTYRQTGPIAHELTFLWIDLFSGSEYQLRAFAVADEYSAVIASSPLPAMRLIPFEARPAAAVSRHGAMLTSGSEFEITEFDVSGGVRRVVRVDSPRRPVTRADVRAVFALESIDRDSPFRRMPLPDSMPVFTTLRIDDLGWLWAQLFEWDPRRATRWMVFDPDGRARGTVSLPAGLEVHGIGTDFVVGVWKDELGVEHVRRHVLRRSGDE